MPPDRRRHRTARKDRGAAPSASGRPTAASQPVDTKKPGPPPPRQDAAAKFDAQRKARVVANKRRSRFVWVLMGGASIALLIALIAYGVMNAIKPQPGVKTPDDGRTHINTHISVSQANLKQYSTDPPTSGPHWADLWAIKGIYQQVPDEQIVHSLEHGYVVMHLNCSETECPDLYNQMKDIYFKYDKKIVLNYRPQTKARIALTAWTRLDTMEASELAKNQDKKEILSNDLKERIHMFIGAYREKIGPELSAP